MPLKRAPGGKPYFEAGYNFASTAQSVTSGEGIFYRYDPNCAHPLVGIALMITTPSGNCKVGVFDSPNADAAIGSLILNPIQVSAGISVTVTGDWQTFALPTTVQASPGHTLFIGHVFDNGTVTVVRNGDTAGIQKLRNRCLSKSSLYAGFNAQQVGFSSGDKTFVICTT